MYFVSKSYLVSTCYLEYNIEEIIVLSKRHKRERRFEEKGWCKKCTRIQRLLARLWRFY